jgi:hypothetical protein
MAAGNAGYDHLCYFDHDKSLLGDGREPSAVPAGDLARIDATSVADWKVRDYLACTPAKEIVLDYTSDGDAAFLNQ